MRFADPATAALAAEYDKAHNAGKVLQQNLVDLAALLGEQLATMPDPREIVAMLENDYLRILAELAASLRADAAAEEEDHASAEVIPDPRACP